LWLSEEERESHVHILGTTGEGKSRFIEHLIRGDIEQGNGVCLLDPTDRADTAFSILKYCAKIGFEKVCLIDPHTIRTHNRVTALQPFSRYKSYKDASVSNVFDTVRILFGNADESDVPRIRRYLPALLRVLFDAEMTITESIYFSDYENPDYAERRKEILSHVDPLDKDRITIEGVFKNYTRFEQYFSSTINRLDPFWSDSLSLMLGAEPGVDFVKMITEGWVILVNLDAEGGVEPIQTRLIGTTVINELLFAMYRLRQNGYNKPYYLYIDEAGQYVNDKLIRILEYKRKAGFRVNIAHQGFFQFPKDKATAVKQLTKIKVMFNTPDYNDRLEMIKALGYGGDIPHLLATYANQDLPKQYAVIKKGKEPPQRVRIPDVEEITEREVSRKALEDFTYRCLLHEWNFSPDEVRSQMEKRFHDDQTTGDIGPPRKRTKANRRATVKTVFD
jgi:hypothetical protein